MKKPFKETKVFGVLKNGLRIVDKFATGGTVFNVLDENNAPEGSFDYPKLLRDLIVWMPFVLLALQFSGLLSPEQKEALEGALLK